MREGEWPGIEGGLRAAIQPRLARLEVMAEGSHASAVLPSSSERRLQRANEPIVVGVANDNDVIELVDDPLDQRRHGEDEQKSTQDLAAYGFPGPERRQPAGRRLQKVSWRIKPILFRLR